MRHDVLMPHLTEPPGMPEVIRSVVDRIGNQARAQILRELALDGPLTARQLADRVGSSSMSVARNLAVLAESGLVEGRSTGGWHAAKLWTIDREAVRRDLVALEAFLLPERVEQA